jgi:hypothetical protein
MQIEGREEAVEKLYLLNEKEKEMKHTSREVMPHCPRL